MQKTSEQLKKDLEEIKKQAMAYKQPQETKETQPNNKFKNNKSGGNSIFDK